MIPIWTGPSTQGNSALAQNYNNSVAPYFAGEAGEQLLASGTDGSISIALEPQGFGALEAQLADNTTTGGTLRGPNAVDWQMSRGLDTEVASGYYSTLSGGQSNTSSSYYGTVSGGAFNSADYGNYATVSGGGFNTANGGSSTVSGGALNISSNAFTTVAGGYFNIASANSATVSGGVVNTVAGDYSTIPGGEHLTLTGSDDFGFLSGDDGIGAGMSVAANNTSVFGNTDLWLADNDNTARALYFYAPYNTSGAFPNGDNYVGFRAGAVTTSVIWTLPLADGTSGQALVTNGSGTLSWGPGGLSHITENYNNSVAPYFAGDAGEQLLASGADATISIALQPQGFGALEAQLADNTTTGGTLRGPNAVDWQMSRGLDTEVASGYYSTLSGGQSNTSSSYYGTVSGGAFNSADYGNYATVSGGGFNTANGGSSTVSGGALNISSNAFTTVAGGYFNIASANSATVSGGVVNTAAGDYSTIPGGEHLTLSGYDDLGFLSAHDGTGNDSMIVTANNTVMFGNTDLWLANNDTSAHALYFYAPYNGGPGAFPNGDNYVGFRAGAVTTSVIWTLPLADGTSGQALTTNGSGTLSWGTVGGGGSIMTVSSTTTVGAGVSEVVCSGTSNITVTLPAASSYASGTEIDFIWTGNATNTATIQPGGSDTLVLGTDATATIQTDASGWNSLGVRSNGTDTWYYCHQ